MKKREAVLIYMELLSSLLDGPKGPTRLAQACNVNYGRIEGFTGPLLRKGLIRSAATDGQETFSITEEGARVYEEWLGIWRKLPLD